MKFLTYLSVWYGVYCDASSIMCFRGPFLKTGPEHPTTSKSNVASFYKPPRKRRKLLNVDVGRQLTLFDVLRKRSSAKRHFVLNKNMGNQNSRSDSGCKTSKASPGVVSNNNKYMGSEWVEMTHIENHQSVLESSNGQDIFFDKSSGSQGVSLRIPSDENVYGLTDIKQSKQPSSSVNDEMHTDQEEMGAARTRRLILDSGPLEGEYQRIKALEVDLQPALYGMYSETSLEQSQQKHQHSIERRQTTVKEKVESQSCAAAKHLVTTCRPCSVVLQPLHFRHSITSRITLVTNNIVKVS